MSSYLIYLLAILGAFLSRRAMRQDDTCKYIAAEILKYDGVDDKKEIKSVVASLTDPNQNKWAFVGYGLLFFCVAYKWYYYGFLSALGIFAVLSLLIALFGMFFYSKPHQPKYVADVLKSLYRRKSEYLTSHDVMRADAVNYFIKKVELRFRLND